MLNLSEIFKCTMRVCLFLGILLEQILDLSASEDYQNIQKLDRESVDIICKANYIKENQDHHLQRFANSEEVRNIYDGRDMRADPEIKGRIKMTGQWDSHAVIVTLFNLRHTDKGLYICESLSGNAYDQPLVNITILLPVKEAGEPSSCDRHSLVIYIILVGVCLLLLSSITFCAAHYKKQYAWPELQLSIPIYEDMAGKGSRANLCQICTHL